MTTTLLNQNLILSKFLSSFLITIQMNLTIYYILQNKSALLAYYKLCAQFNIACKLLLVLVGLNFVYLRTLMYSTSTEINSRCNAQAQNRILKYHKFQLYNSDKKWNRNIKLPENVTQNFHRNIMTSVMITHERRILL